jgi:acyl-CoA synthetase (AMP-forming)/AMP-acid ligase II
VPTVLQAIASAPNYDPARMESLKLVIHGGAPIAAALLERISDEWREAELCHLYGTTETMIPFFNRSPKDNPTQFSVGYSHRARVTLWRRSFGSGGARRVGRTHYRRDHR